MRRRERPLAIFGALPPPSTGMETFTANLLDLLRREGGIAWRHVDMSLSEDISKRSHVTPGKALRVLAQAARSCRLAPRYDAYYPISQNRIGLVRDALLLAPFRLAGRRIVLHLHGGALHRVLASEPRWLRAVVGWIASAPRTSGIALTPRLRECLLPLMPADRIRVVHNTALVPDWTVAKPPLEDGLNVLFLSTLIESKGYRELISAVLSLEPALRVSLEVAGEPYAEEDRRWLAALPDDERVRFSGRIEGDEKWHALARSHVLALPTTYGPEGQPLSIIEGMAAACAIVATRWAGIVETLDEDEAVLLTPATGAPLEAAIAGALRGLARNPGRVAALRQAARARFERELAPSRFLPAWRDAVSRPARGAPPQSLPVAPSAGTRRRERRAVGER